VVQVKGLVQSFFCILAFGKVRAMLYATLALNQLPGTDGCPMTQNFPLLTYLQFFFSFQTLNPKEAG